MKRTIQLALLMGALLGTQSAHAEIIYSGPNRDVLLDQSNPVQIINIANNCAEWDNLAIGLWVNNHPNCGSFAKAFTLPRGLGNRVKTVASNGNAERLLEHYAINASLNYTISKSRFFSSHYSYEFETANCNGKYLDETGYMALQLLNQDETYYGWARISGENHDCKNVRLMVHEWAYNNTPGEEILTGQTSMPEPSSITMAAVGSTGLLFFRRIFMV